MGLGLLFKLSTNLKSNGRDFQNPEDLRDLLFTKETILLHRFVLKLFPKMKMILVTISQSPNCHLSDQQFKSRKSRIFIYSQK